MPRIKERHTPIRFKDCNEYRGCNGTYYATNEEPKLFAEFLKDVEVNRAAAICSGGEIGLFVLLPKVKRELVLIDHHYETMSFAMIKWLLIQTVGGKEAHRLLTTSNKELFGHIKKLYKRLPSPLREKYNEVFETAKKTKNYWGDPARHYDNHYSVISGFCRPETGPNSTVKREWLSFKAEDVEAIEDCLHKVQFLHGDLVEDLKKRKPFDLLYISNAMQYSGRSMKRMTAEQIFGLVKPGGLILSTDSLHNYSTFGDPIKEIKPRVEIYEKLMKGSRTSWGHFLTRVPEASAVPV